MPQTYPPPTKGQALCDDADAEYLHHRLRWQRLFSTSNINRSQAMAHRSFSRSGHFRLPVVREHSLHVRQAHY